MKLIGRTVAILAAAMVVVGLTVAFGSSSLASNLSGGRPDRPVAAIGQAAGATTNGRSPRDRGEATGFNAFGIGEVLKNLGIVGAIVAIVALGKRLSRRWQAPKPRRAPPTAAPSV